MNDIPRIDEELTKRVKDIIILLAFVLLTSCAASKEVNTNVTTPAENTDIISEEESAEIVKRLIDTSNLEGYNPEGYISNSVCDGGDCYYITGHAFSHQVLYYMDKATLECKILCDIEGCQHNKNTCQACVKGAASNIVYDDGRLYWFSKESISDSAKMHTSGVIWCMNLETKVRARLGEIENPEGAQSDQSFGKGCAMGLSVLYDENGAQLIGIRFNLSTKEKTELFRKNIKMHNASQYFYENCFYYASAFSYNEGKSSVCAYKWDSDSGEETELLSQTVDEYLPYFADSGDAAGINLYSVFADYAGGITAYRLDYSNGVINKIADFDFSEYGSFYDYTNNSEGNISGFKYVNGVMYAMVKTSENSLVVVGKDKSGSEVFKTNVDNLNVTDFPPHVADMGADDRYIFLGVSEQILSRNYQMNIVVAVPTDGSEPIIVGEHISDLTYKGW